jgi:Core-2/I-Branching enzyme
MVIGFIILSHGGSLQLTRLIDGLNSAYGKPPIVCHHDFGQSRIPIEHFESNVTFVQPHVATGWGKFSVVEASLKALALLYESSRPDWFFLLSAGDYPVVSGAQVRAQLTASRCDVYMDARALEAGDLPRARTEGARNPKLSHFDDLPNVKIKKRFYLSREFWLPIVRRTPRLRIGRYTWRPGLRKPSVLDRVRCFYGDHWFHANAKAAQVLLSPTEEHLALRRHLANRTQADEAYYQTVLMNDPTLTVNLDNKRFAEWNGGGAHPMILEPRQVPEILASGAFFARKILHSEVPDMLDASIKPDPPIDNGQA